MYILQETAMSDINPRASLNEVKFDTNGGSSVEPQIVPEGGKVARPEDPVLACHIFRDWYTDSELSLLYDFDAEVENPFTLYAGWDDFDGSVSAECNTVTKSYVDLIASGGRVDSALQDLLGLSAQILDIRIQCDEDGSKLAEYTADAQKFVDSVNELEQNLSLRLDTSLEYLTRFLPISKPEE
jgi:hypothetical protein